MIKFLKANDSAPYRKFKDLYEEASKLNQASIEAISISSFNKLENEVDSRYVNLKYIDNENWTFFSNYNSKKAKDFETHNQISGSFFWDVINTQIRIKGYIKRSKNELSNKHFTNRSSKKNALAISSRQSTVVDSYDDILNNYNKVLKSSQDLSIRPKYWGGYTFEPYYFEFWAGNSSRINSRQSFRKYCDIWEEKILEP
jgi:pyridoxamine 5'-phosphate oxidase